jgi:hypothetical protein
MTIVLHGWQFVLLVWLWPGIVLSAFVWFVLPKELRGSAFMCVCRHIAVAALWLVFPTQYACHKRSFHENPKTLETTRI